jgi:excisionase family DNA binding protein
MRHEQAAGRKLSVAEAAVILGVSRFTVRAWIRQRRLAFHRLGRRIVLDLRDLETFLARHRIEAGKQS